MSSEQTRQGGSSKRKTAGGKKGGTLKNADNNEPISLVRNESLGMAPRAILTGFYGSRGERLRHTVHDGALKMPKHAIDLIERATEDTNISAQESYSLPGLDCVVRPCLDMELAEVVVTEISFDKVAVPQEAPTPADTADGTSADEQTKPEVIYVDQCKATNRTHHRSFFESAPTARIRGGGADGDDKMDVDATPAPEQSNAENSEVKATLPIESSGTQASTSTGPDAENVASQQHSAPEVESSASTGAHQPSASSDTKNAADTTKEDTGTHQSVPNPGTGDQSASKVVLPADAQAPASAPAVQVEQTPTAKTSSPRPVVSESVAILPDAQGLASKPAAHWVQHKPGPNDEMVTPADQLTPRPAWYKSDGVADVERAMLPEWFDCSASHRTDRSYIAAREKIIAVSDTIANRNVTNAMVRRYVVGDSGSLHRLRQFLVNFGLINEDGINDSAPTPAVLRDTKPKVPESFDETLRGSLLDAIVEQTKKRKIDEMSADEPEFVPIDWDEVAIQVGRGTTSSACERNFLSLDLERDASSPGERSITPDENNEATKTTSVAADIVSGEHEDSAKDMQDQARKDVIRNLIESSSGDIVQKVIKTSLESTGADLKKAQTTALLGLAAAQAVEEARKDEAALSSVLSQLVNQRMKKLENRMALLDDVEALMEAEKVALELERRDLYTARCRHWFGGA